MKKTLTAILALVFAFAAIFAISCIAFADEDTAASAAATSEAEVNNGRATTTVSTTVATTASTTASTTAAITITTTKKLNDNSESDTAAVVSNTGTTINANNITVGSTSKAAVVSNVPHTGSSIAVPAVAVLALLCGTVAVVKTKKD